MTTTDDTALPLGQIIQGDALEVLRTWPACSVHAAVTDPPYGLHFMGQAWDGFRATTAHREPRGKAGAMRGTANEAGRNAEYGRFVRRVARELHRVLVPGGHLLMFGAPRRHHWQGVALELAGFEVRDCLMWLFGTGFPKSHNLDGPWAGWGTALKPAWEPILLSRKPPSGTVTANMQEHGAGALNVDGCRIGTSGGYKDVGPRGVPDSVRVYGNGLNRRRGVRIAGMGRWPANVVLDDTAAADLDAAAKRQIGSDVSRYFYCPKASPAEREAGLREAGLREAAAGGLQGRRDGTLGGEPIKARNNHPTVKPLDLMRWLVRMVTPPGGVVLDPFAGSGSTLCAATLEGVHWLGIEHEERYCVIARARTTFWTNAGARGITSVAEALRAKRDKARRPLVRK